MDSDSPSPAKRPRVKSNVPLTECVREFKLPQQYPSMAKKTGNSDTSNDISKKHSISNTLLATTKTPILTKVMINQEKSPMPNIIRKIKLKGKDGRDLGEVNVQDLPRNIQGKTITLSKNTIMKPPEGLSTIDKKVSNFGVLTPVSMVKTEKFLANRSPSICLNNDSKDILNMGKDVKKTTVVEQKQMSMVMDSQGRPNVLVFQVRNNWHMVKLATSEPNQIQQNSKSAIGDKLPLGTNLGKATILQAKEYSQIAGSHEDIKKLAINSLGVNKTCNTNFTNVLAKKWTQYSTSDGTAEKQKPKAQFSVENGESRPKIEISRVYGSSSDKKVSQMLPVTQLHSRKSENSGSSINSTNSLTKNTSLKRDVMVVLPTDIPDDLDNCSENVVTPSSNLVVHKKSSDDKITNSIGETRNQLRIPMADTDKNSEMSSHLSILTKALSMVGDKELREKALKALADCGIGMERLVPICPPSDQRPVKDSGTQTSIFGIFDPDNFIQVTPENPDVERIRPIERKAARKVGHIVGNPQYQELALNGLNIPILPPARDLTDLAEMVETFVKGNEGVSEVRNMLAKPVSKKLVSELEKDFQNYKKYDENGMLNIHKAVIDGDISGVTRQLKVLKACNESTDIPTTDGSTSLELAVRYESCQDIVKLLLESGAEPTSSEVGHDSALIIASKKSLPIIKPLVHYVKKRKYLNNYDSSGFTALHYCAQNNDVNGVIELTRASADVNLQDRRSGRTALFHAIENEYFDIAHLLLDKGAISNIPSYSGHTVFALVEESKHYNLVEALHSAEK